VAARCRLGGVQGGSNDIGLRGDLERQRAHVVVTPRRCSTICGCFRAPEACQ
jgi:hypothetical protein